MGQLAPDCLTDQGRGVGVMWRIVVFPCCHAWMHPSMCRYLIFDSPHHLKCMPLLVIRCVTHIKIFSLVNSELLSQQGSMT